MNNLYGLKGKKVFVTGATGQLGYEICKAYINVGSKVIGGDKKFNKDKMLNDVEYVSIDISIKESINEAFKYIYLKYDKLNILINNAGVSCFEPFEERPEESFDWVMDVNLKGTFFATQAFVNCSREKDYKRNIINIASIYGIISPDFRIYTDCERKNSEVYGATKAGIIQMTKYFAVYLEHYGFRVNCVSPGGIYNPESPQGSDFVNNYSNRCPMKRMANASEIIGGILYLSSDAASYTNGHNLIIDGGMNIW